MPPNPDPPESFLLKASRKVSRVLLGSAQGDKQSVVITAAGVTIARWAVGWAMDWVADHKPLIDELRAGIAHTVGTYLGKLIAVAVLCGCGYGLAALKRRQPIVYGNRRSPSPSWRSGSPSDRAPTIRAPTRRSWPPACTSSCED